MFTKILAVQDFRKNEQKTIPWEVAKLNLADPVTTGFPHSAE